MTTTNICDNNKDFINCGVKIVLRVGYGRCVQNDQALSWGIRGIRLMEEEEEY